MACERQGGKANAIQTMPHDPPNASSNSAPLFYGEFTCLLTSQAFSTSSAAGFSSTAGSPATSPNHGDQSSG